jgi:HEAT repeats
MTDPATSPASLQEPSSQAAAPVDKRSRKVYVYWGVALALLLALGLFCWLVVVPNRRTHAVILDADAWEKRGISFDYIDMVIDSDKVVSQLGGPSEARRQLLVYISQPEWCASARTMAVYALVGCGEEATPDLKRLCQHKDKYVRQAAAEALKKIKAKQEKSKK